MKYIQRILALLFVCAFVFACVAGCAPKNDPTEPSGTVGSTNPPRQDDATGATTDPVPDASENNDPTEAKTEPTATEDGGSTGGDSNGGEATTEAPTEPATEGDTGSTEAPTTEPTEPLPTLDDSNLGQWVG